MTVKPTYVGGVQPHRGGHAMWSWAMIAGGSTARTGSRRASRSAIRGVTRSATSTEGGYSSPWWTNPPPLAEVHTRCHPSCRGEPLPSLLCRQTIPRPTSLPVSAMTKPARCTNRARAAEALAGMGINGAWTLVNHGLGSAKQHRAASIFHGQSKPRRNRSVLGRSCSSQALNPSKGASGGPHSGMFPRPEDSAGSSLGRRDTRFRRTCAYEENTASAVPSTDAVHRVKQLTENQMLATDRPSAESMAVDPPDLHQLVHQRLRRTMDACGRGPENEGRPRTNTHVVRGAASDYGSNG